MKNLEKYLFLKKISALANSNSIAATAVREQNRKNMTPESWLNLFHETSPSGLRESYLGEDSLLPDREPLFPQLNEASWLLRQHNPFRRNVRDREKRISPANFVRDVGEYLFGGGQSKSSFVKKSYQSPLSFVGTGADEPVNNLLSGDYSYGRDRPDVIPMLATMRALRESADVPSGKLPEKDLSLNFRDLYNPIGPGDNPNPWFVFQNPGNVPDSLKEFRPSTGTEGTNALSDLERDARRYETELKLRALMPVMAGAGAGGLGGYGLTSLLTRNRLARALGTLGGAAAGGYLGHRFAT